MTYDYLMHVVRLHLFKISKTLRVTNDTKTLY